MTNEAAIQAASTLEDLIREQYPQAVVTCQGTKFVALTGTEPGDRTEFKAPEGPMTFPHAYAVAHAIIDEWDSRKASNPYA